MVSEGIRLFEAFSSLVEEENGDEREKKKKKKTETGKQWGRPFDGLMLYKPGPQGYQS